MKEIFTTGYPKSGNTWLLDLIATMLNAPSSKDINIPPLFKPDDKYVVYKLHMPNDTELSAYHCYTDDLRERVEKGYLIFIHRDPRSTFVSALQYRNLIDTSNEERTSNNLQGVILQQTAPYKKNVKMGHYERWVRSYLDKPESYSYATTYEKLHSQSIVELTNISDVIGVEIPKQKIIGAVNSVAFPKNQKEDPHFFWKGKPDTWKQYFKQSHGKLMTERMGEFMVEFGFIKSLDWWKELPEE